MDGLGWVGGRKEIEEVLAIEKGRVVYRDIGGSVAATAAEGAGKTETDSVEEDKKEGEDAAA